MGFSRQEHWSGLPVPSPKETIEKRKWSRSVVSNSATPWTVAHQAPLSMGFSRQEYWSGLPFPSPYHFYVESKTWYKWTFLSNFKLFISYWELGFPGGSDGKQSACNARDSDSILSWEDPLEKGMATHSSLLAWRIPWTERPGRL